MSYEEQKQAAIEEAARTGKAVSIKRPAVKKYVAPTAVLTEDGETRDEYLLRCKALAISSGACVVVEYAAGNRA